NFPTATNEINPPQKWYHFIGIGGISMSALANLLSYEKNKITGSDLNSNFNPDLKLDKFPIYTGHKSENIGNCDIVVYNSAIKETNLEIVRAKEKNIPLKGRAELLSEIADKYENVISISGMHGKTTTTEMIAEVFIHAGKNPTVHLGGISNYFNSNLRIGGKEFFITEACEYKNSFLSLKSTVGVVLNIEPEHLDFFKSFSEIKNSFSKFAHTSKMTVAPCNLNPDKTIMFKNNQGFSAKNISISRDGKISFDCYFKDSYFDTIVLNALGMHNVDNALACIAAANYFKIKKEHIRTALLNYKGVKRRMEIIKTTPLIISDYAHHPTEILSSINALKQHLEVRQFADLNKTDFLLDIDKKENVKKNVSKNNIENNIKKDRENSKKESEIKTKKNIKRKTKKKSETEVENVIKRGNKKNGNKKKEKIQISNESENLNINFIKGNNYGIKKENSEKESGTETNLSEVVSKKNTHSNAILGTPTASFTTKKETKLKSKTNNITKTKIEDYKNGEKSKNRLLVVFQPHTYSRTQAFMGDFVKVLSVADTTFIYKTYAAREKPIKGASAYDLYLKLRKIKKNAKYFKSFIDLAENIKKESEDNSATTLILGAGDIEKLIPYLT
ncbi:MAG: Mur ligase domain-containing protein, partial [Clostridia bacterium]|nr:Mur ligase domain-containing protein [Clostridia bacterium]